MRKRQAGVQSSVDLNFSKMRVGLKTIDDAIIDLQQSKKANPRFANKEYVE